MHIASGFLGRLCAPPIYKYHKINTLQKQDAHCLRNFREAVCSLTQIICHFLIEIEHDIFRMDLSDSG